MFNYSVHYYQKKCIKNTDKIKIGLSKALEVNYKGLRILKQDLSKGITMVNDPYNPNNASIYFRDEKSCENLLKVILSQ